MTRDSQILYLTDADVSGLGLDVGKVRVAIQEMFRRYSEGLLLSEPKTSIAIRPGHAFQSLVAVDTQRNVAGLKWVGMIPPGGVAKANINAYLLLSDVQTGQLLCLMDARQATALRTAGMTAVAASYLARKDSACIGFVGAGVQAESHLLAFVELLPALQTVYVNDRRRTTAQRFAEKASELGLEARMASAEETVRQSDVVVTTVPLGPEFEPFIEAGWVRPGTFAAAVDLGRSWMHSGLSEVEVTVVDEGAMRHYAKAGNFIPPLEYAHATLADLVIGRHQGRSGKQERILYFSSGSAVADLAIATLIFEQAVATGAGMELPR